MKKNLVFKILSLVLFLSGIVAVAIFGIKHAPNQQTTPNDSVYVTDSATQNTSEIITLPENNTPENVTAVQSATITVVGDVLPHSNVYNAAYDATSETYNFDPFFEYVTPYISKADYSVANLEVPLAGIDNGLKYSGYPHFNCPDNIAVSLKSAGFDLATTANNHCFDQGFSGLKRTLRIISNQGLNTLGTTFDKDSTSYLVKKVNGIRIGMMSYTFATGTKLTPPSINGNPTTLESVGHINSFNYNYLENFYDEVEKHITSMKKEGAEAIVMYIHWGNEYQTTPNGTQKTIAQKLCDLGVDVIVGGHPHVIQPLDLLESTVNPNHKTVCLYSTGNFLSNQRTEHMGLKTGHTEDGIMFTFTFTKYSNGTVALESTSALPTWVCLHRINGKLTYSILPLDKTIEDWQTTYKISKENETKAIASHERTMALIQDGLTKTNAYLQECSEAILKTANSSN